MVGGLKVEKFIEAIPAKPPHSNRRHPMHRNAKLMGGLRNAGFTEIGGDLTVSELKQKWRNLRDGFRREQRNEKEGKKQPKEALRGLSDKSDLGNIEDMAAPDFPTKIETADEKLEFDLNNADSDQSEFIENENFTHKIKIEADDDTLDDGLYNKSYENESNEKTLIPKTEVTNEEEEYSRKPNDNDVNPLGAGESSNCCSITSCDDDYHFAMSFIPQYRQGPTQRKPRMRIRILEIIAQEAGYDETC